MALWFFNKVLWFVLAAMLEGILLRSNMAAKTSFCLYLVNRLIVALKCAVNVTTSSFQYFPWSFKCKICVQKEVIDNFWKSHFGHVTSYELNNFKKMVRVWKTKSLLFFKIWPTNRFSKAKSYNFHFHKSDVTSLCKWPITRDTKTNYVIIGSLTPRTKAWFLYAVDVSATQPPVPSGLLPGRIRTCAAGN